MGGWGLLARAHTLIREQHCFVARFVSSANGWSQCVSSCLGWWVVSGFRSHIKAKVVGGKFAEIYCALMSSIDSVVWHDCSRGGSWKSNTRADIYKYYGICTHDWVVADSFVGGAKSVSSIWCMHIYKCIHICMHIYKYTYVCVLYPMQLKSFPRIVL